MKIYLAGPDVFREKAVEFGEILKQVCAKYGHEGMYPFDNEVDPPNSENIYKANFEMIKNCDVILANMQKFRGPSMDVGTAWEVGAGVALGKKVYLYNSTGLDYKSQCNKQVIDGTSFPMIEDFGLEDNLMLIESASGIYKTIDDALKALEE